MRQLSIEVIDSTIDVWCIIIKQKWKISFQYILETFPRSNVLIQHLILLNLKYDDKNTSKWTTMIAVANIKYMFTISTVYIYILDIVYM